MKCIVNSLPWGGGGVNQMRVQRHLVSRCMYVCIVRVYVIRKWYRCWVGGGACIALMLLYVPSCSKYLNVSYALVSDLGGPSSLVGSSLSFSLTEASARCRGGGAAVLGFVKFPRV